MSKVHTFYFVQFVNKEEQQLYGYGDVCSSLNEAWADAFKLRLAGETPIAIVKVDGNVQTVVVNMEEAGIPMYERVKGGPCGE